MSSNDGTGIFLESSHDGPLIPIQLLTMRQAEAARADQPELMRWAAIHEFTGKAGQCLCLPDADGRIGRVLFGLGNEPEPMTLRALPAKLPAGDYRFETLVPEISPDFACLAFALGCYRYDRYRSATSQRPRLSPADGVDRAELERLVSACTLARDLINTPASDLGPAELEHAVRRVGERMAASVSVIMGDALLTAGYPTVHAVGRAAGHGRAPRMITLEWGDPSAPNLVLIGKGVTFDTGGLDLKPSAGMRWMKKDMGGAAHALALAELVMTARLPVHLTLLIPAVENAVSGDAMRPGDVLSSRKGLTIEVGNTDAEGRLILADALCRAGELNPDLTIDFATLTGAARVALGPQLPPFFTLDDGLADALQCAANQSHDPLWRMPLWAGYDDALTSDIADLKNDADAWAQAGAITAALFLKRFAPASAWLHLDIFAWNPKARPGWPSGAEAQGLRALYAHLKARYA